MGRDFYSVYTGRAAPWCALLCRWLGSQRACETPLTKYQCRPSYSTGKLKKGHKGSYIEEASAPFYNERFFSDRNILKLWSLRRPICEYLRKKSAIHIYDVVYWAGATVFRFLAVILRNDVNYFACHPSWRKGESAILGNLHYLFVRLRKTKNNVQFCSELTHRSEDRKSVV